MRAKRIKLMLAIAVITLTFTTTQAQALRTVEVSAPAINCLFDPTCRIEVNDSTDSIPIGAGGSNFLQSRTFTGRAGSPAEGLYVYEYRIDLRRATGILNIPCLESLSLDFGPVVQTLDFNADGEFDEVFVVTRGGLGTVGLASANKAGNTITFRFSDLVCAGGRPGEGQSTFFFGLVSTHSPLLTTASVVETHGQTHTVDVRTPRPIDPLHDKIQPEASPKKGASLSDSSVPEIDRSVPLQAKGVNQPVIERLGPEPCVDKGGRATIFGSHFGNYQAGRLVELVGHGIGVLLPVISWTDTRIVVLIPHSQRIQFSQWYYIGLQDRNRHWISNISRTINICRGLE